MNTDPVVNHIRSILDTGHIVMTSQGPLGPADVERVALSGMTRDEAIKVVYGGGDENPENHG